MTLAAPSRPSVVPGASAQSGVDADPVGDPDLLFERGVPRQLVHRAAIAEVFVTDGRAIGEQRYRVAAQWPRAHAYYCPTGRDHYDPILLLETVRQACAYAAHVDCGMPATHHFVLGDIRYDLDHDAMRIDASPAEITLDLAYVQRVRGRSSSFDFTVECRRGGQRLGTARVTGCALADATYARMRGPVAVDPGAPQPRRVDPGSVGWRQDDDVLVGACAAGGPDALDVRWLLHAGRKNPVHYDHPVDHVPGMVLVEAGRQTARLVLGTPGAVVIGARVSFRHYVEFGSECEIGAEILGPAPDGATFVQVVFHQRGELAAECMLRLITPARGDATSVR